jgi:LysM repeat protein
MRANAVRVGVSGLGAQRGRVRLTRRGRAVLIVLALVLAGLAVLLAAPASQAADPVGTTPTVVVRSGDTLWSIAARYVPSDDPFATIDQIRELNGLSGYTIRAGQRLTLPRHR